MNYLISKWKIWVYYCKCNYNYYSLIVSLMVILFCKKCFLFVYMYIRRSIKFQANKLFENSDADLPWLLF